MPALAPIGQPFIELQQVDSTNNYAIALAREGMAHHGLTVFTHEQTRGRGQRDKQWQSQAYQNIAMSAVISPDLLGLHQPSLLNMAVAIAVRNFVALMVNEVVKIKWPNDIFINDRKAAGILIENLWQGQNWNAAIAGIGINVNQTDFGELDDVAVSLAAITGIAYEPLDLARRLCGYLTEALELLTANDDQICSLYQQQLYKLHERVRLRKENRTFEGIILGCTKNGELIVNTGVEESFRNGEVVLVRGNQL